MKLKLAVLLLILFGLGGSAFGQGVFISPKTVFGTVNGITRPIPAATITVCAAGSAGLPCSPALAGTLFKDAALTQPLANPFPADANGNYQFAVASGVYTVTETTAGFAGYSYQLTVACSVGACSISTLTVTGSIIAPSIGPSSGQQHTLPAVASDTFGLVNAAQSPINKNFTTASNGNTVTLLNAQANSGPITGTGSAATVYTYTLPANAVGNLKGLRLTASWTHGGVATVTYNATLNGQSITGGTWGFSCVCGHSVVATVLNTGGTAGTAQAIETFNGGTVLSEATALTGLAWNSGQVLTLTFNVAATDQVTPIQWIVELIQ